MTPETQKILSKTLDIYTKYGIKSVTMDDVARELGISKKTLYQHFDNKHDLVKQTVEHYILLECNAFEQISESADNAIDELFGICNFVCQIMRERNPSLMLDMKKYHPESWQVFMEHKTNYAYNNFLDNIKRGIKQGFYRDDFDIDIITKLYLARIEAIIDPELFPFHKYPMVHVVNEMLKYHIRGIATATGLQYLEEINNDNRHEHRA